MRILSVVTLVSPMGEYGGPLRVAVNQCAALQERGHDVQLAGAFRGYRHAPTSVEGVPARLFRAVNIIPWTGFAGLSSPSLWAWVARTAHQFDVVHIHAARDLVTLPTAWLVAQRGVRYVVQAHGMIDESDRALAIPLDAILTRTVLRRAHRVLYLTDVERGDLANVARHDSIELAELPNGVPDSTLKPDNSGEVEVLYLARLAKRKRPLAIVRAAESLFSEFPDARFAIVGPDEGEGRAVSLAVQSAQRRGVRVSWEGGVAPGDAVCRLARSAIYVLPAVDEPYPMSVLEAMSIGLPVIITESCGLASFVNESGSGLVVGADEESLVEAIRTLLANPTLASQLGAAGREAVRGRLSMNSIAARLESVYAG
ncbi:glycosyltransferase [Mycobacterium sp. C31M]